MSLPVGSGAISPYMVMAFVQQHAAEYSQMIKDQMETAHGRLQLMKEIAELAAQLELAKNTERWDIANEAIAKFMKYNKEAWGGAEHDMCSWWAHTDAWSKGLSVKPDTYKQVNHANAVDGWASWKGTWETSNGVDKEAARSMVDSWIKELNAWKDEIAGKDKLALMELSDSTSRLNELYQLGSNLNAKLHESAMAIISNLGR